MEKELVLVDNTVLSNFALIERDDILNSLFKDLLYTTHEVLQELRLGEDKGILPKRDWRWIKILKIESSQEEFLFSLFTDTFGKGESSCLSIAKARTFKVLTDDLDARKLAQRIGIPISGTIGILVSAIREGILSINEGNAMLLKMVEKGYFSPLEKLDELI